MHPQINILPSNNIDFTKWDKCVANNSNGLIYSQSLYLNHLADNWSGLVVNDYEAILPLPWRKKWGIKYVYTVPFAQQMGIVGNAKFDLNLIVKNIHRFVKYGTLTFNYDNTDLANLLQCTKHNNYTLQLNQNIETIEIGFKSSFKKNLKRALNQNLQYQVSQNIEEAIELFYNYNKQKSSHVKFVNYKSLQNISLLLAKNNQAIVRKVVDTNNKTLSIALLLKDNKRMYNLVNYTSENGRKQESNYFLYYNLFKEFANTNLIFDFEGSDLPGVKSFYETTGAINQPYFSWHFNKLFPF